MKILINQLSMTHDYLNAILKNPTTRTPIWIMRQAGRYLPEYRATREKAGGFLGLCKNPEFACEVTMQPIDVWLSEIFYTFQGRQWFFEPWTYTLSEIQSQSHCIWDC